MERGKAGKRANVLLRKAAAAPYRMMTLVLHAGLDTLESPIKAADTTLPNRLTFANYCSAHSAVECRIATKPLTVYSGACSAQSQPTAIGQINAGDEISYVVDSSHPVTDASCLEGKYNWIKIAWAGPGNLGGFAWTQSSLINGATGTNLVGSCPAGMRYIYSRGIPYRE